MSTAINNSNDSSKRTSNQVKSILKGFGFEGTIENSGDGRCFITSNTELSNRIAIKKAGFILNRSLASDTTLTFCAF